MFCVTTDILFIYLVCSVGLSGIMLQPSKKQSAICTELREYAQCVVRSSEHSGMVFSVHCILLPSVSNLLEVFSLKQTQLLIICFGKTIKASFCGNMEKRLPFSSLEKEGKSHNPESQLLV